MAGKNYIRKIFISLFCIIVAQLGLAQRLDGLTERQGDSVDGLTGTVTIKEAPVELNLPEGFVYLDAPTAKGILCSCVKDTSSVDNVIGMIVPKDTHSIIWIMSCDSVGHVQDNKASGMDFTRILEDLRNSDQYKGVQLDWAWSPKYDSQHHRLSLPLRYITATDSVLSACQYIFGNEGMIRVESFAPFSDVEWFSENNA